MAVSPSRASACRSSSCERWRGASGLVNALNLDGGGSTTMWVQGQVLNRPSDPTGPRKVSDALLVYGGKQ